MIWIFALFYEALHQKKNVPTFCVTLGWIFCSFSVSYRVFSISKVRFDAFYSHIKYGTELNLLWKIEAKSVQKNTHCIFMNILYFIFPFSMSQKVLQELLVPRQITWCPHCWVLEDSGINVHPWDILSDCCQVWLCLNYSLLSVRGGDWRVQLLCHDGNSRGASLVQRKALWCRMWRLGWFIFHHNWADSQNKQPTLGSGASELFKWGKTGFLGKWCKFSSNLFELERAAAPPCCLKAS